MQMVSRYLAISYSAVGDNRSDNDDTAKAISYSAVGDNRSDNDDTAKAKEK